MHRTTPNDLEQIKRITRQADSAAEAAAEAAAGAGSHAWLTIASIEDAGRIDETARYHADVAQRYAAQADCQSEAARIVARAFPPISAMSSETGNRFTAAVGLLQIAIQAHRRSAAAHATAARFYADAAAAACRPAEQEAATD